MFEFEVEKGAGKHLFRGNLLVDVVNENEKNEKKNDKWSGIHESLKAPIRTTHDSFVETSETSLKRRKRRCQVQGLTSFIAKIGSPERLRSSRSPEATWFKRENAVSCLCVCLDCFKTNLDLACTYCTLSSLLKTRDFLKMIF